MTDIIVNHSIIKNRLDNLSGFPVSLHQQIITTFEDYKIFPESVKDIIIENLVLVRAIIDWFHSKFEYGLLDNSKDPTDIDGMFQVGENSVKKKKYMRFRKILLDWLKDTCFFTDLVEYSINESDIQQFEKVPIPETVEFRQNQTEAFDVIAQRGLETGIHCQATGCGKTFIILRYIEHTKKVVPKPKVILFTERVSILSDLFDFTAKGGINKGKIREWKNKGICDITDFSIINRVTKKAKDWPDTLMKSDKPTLLVINRAFLTLGALYTKFEQGNITLIIHDECHNTSSTKCHDFLKHCKSVGIPIVGFSATPLRTTSADKQKLLEIYGCLITSIGGMKTTELNLLTNYNMIYAISAKLILPPEFHWFQVDEYEGNTEDKTITQEEIGSVMEILNNIIPSLPNKKIIAWCGTIKLAKEWKTIFEKYYKQRKNMRHFVFGLDTSETHTSDYEEFKSIKEKSILFCASKHREGSDIRLLDCCIFLDKVKNRGAIPFIQSIGRVLRLCRETPGKTKGVVIDGITKTNDNYEKVVIEKVIGYYMSLFNMSINDGPVEGNYEQFVKILDVVKFDKEHEIINMKIGDTNIEINCQKLEWDNIIKKFQPMLQHKIKLSIDDVLKMEFERLKERIAPLGFDTKERYAKYARRRGLEMKPEIRYAKHGWKNYYDFLGVDTSKFPKSAKHLKDVCAKHNITTEDKYITKASTLNLPLMPQEMFKYGIDYFLEKIDK